MKQYLVIFILILCVAASGCGSGFKVTGKVMFSDGQPLTVGKVIFTNGQISAFGKINSHGEYRLGLIKEGDGIPAGTYQVYITEAFQPGDNSLSYKDEEGQIVTPLVLVIDPKFTVASQSGLKCEVNGSMKFDIQVEKPGKDYKPLPTKDDLL
ncbi:MAG: hypothetical protein LBC02_00645 [Planctomycetaceae bacterium]|jgi:hypothetical protein|nr:hypothetical protein [Planctomycetaceae bacterium]